MDKNASRHIDRNIPLISLIITLLIVFIVDSFKIPNPNVILLTVSIYFTFIGGFFSGGISGLIVILYSIYFFSSPGELLSFTPLNLKKIIVIVVFVPIAIMIVGALKRQYLLERKALEKANKELRRLSEMDGLTGILNRYHLDDEISKKYELARSAYKPISLLMADIDFFKEYNDCYGHIAGDHCLKQIAQAISQELGRTGNSVARYGGEEFAVILYDTGLNDAKTVAGRIAETVHTLNIEHKASPISSIVTISIGVASISSFEGCSCKDCIEKADKALYQAKNKGRNRIEFF